jgi:serine/threonine protein phosphatase PrpC
VGILRDMLKKPPESEERKPTEPSAHAPADRTQVKHQDETLVSARKQPVDKGKADQPMIVGCASHVGRVRQRNEDSALALTSVMLGDSSLPPFGLFIVADGMGGHSGGQEASQLATRIVAREVMSQIYTHFLQIDPTGPSKPTQEILVDAVQACHSQVNANNPQSGTTLTAVLVMGDQLYGAHVGDSRAYLLCDGESAVELLTIDHSLVQRLQDTGQITPEEAAVHPQKNILYRAVGQEDRLEVDTFARRLPKPSWLLLCSDGLWGVVRPELINAIPASAVNPQQACDELVDAALDAGGPDNITVVIVRFE